MLQESFQFADTNATTLPVTDLETAGGSSTASVTGGFLQTAKHPTICLVHITSKLVPFISFLFASFIFGGWEGDYVFSFVCTTILLSMDFWITKNITGRLLVGMRWWNNVLEDGTNEWKFESQTSEEQVNRTDKIIFWSLVYGEPILWGITCLSQLIQLEFGWMLLCIVGIVLGSANFIGYWKCSGESKRKLQQWASSELFKAFIARGAGFFGGLFGSSLMMSSDKTSTSGIPRV